MAEPNIDPKIDAISIRPAATPPDDWSAFPTSPTIAPKTASKSAWDAFPTSKPDTSLTGYATDLGKSLISGVGKGVAYLGGLGGDLQSLAQAVDPFEGLAKKFDENFPEASKFLKEESAKTMKSPLMQKAGSGDVPGVGGEGVGLPTSDQIKAQIADKTGGFHEPETTPGKYAEKVGEYVPAAALGPGGLLRKLVTQAAIPAVGDETAGELTKGTKYEPYARAAGGVFGGIGASLLSRPGSAAQTIRSQLPNGTTEQHIDDALHLIHDARTRGINLSWPEALSQAAGRPVLTDSMRILESSPETRTHMQDFFAGRPQQFDQAALDEFARTAPGTTTPSSIGRQAGEAAGEHLADVRQTINHASEPFYQASEGVLLTPQEMTHVRAIPGFDDALQAVRDNPQINWRVQHLPDNSVGVLNAVKKQFDQAAENSASKFNPARNQEVQASNEMAASALKRIGVAKSADYETALQIQQQARERFLQPLLDGPLGKIAKKDATTSKAIEALFPSNPLPNSHHEVSTAVTALAARNPWAARQLVRAYAESVWNDAARSLQSGPNQGGAAKFATKIAGNAQQRENLRAAFEALPHAQTHTIRTPTGVTTIGTGPSGPELWDGFQRFLQIAEATGQRQAIGSKTSFNDAERKMLEGSGVVGEAVKTGLSPGKWWTVINDKWSKWKLGSNLNDLAGIFTNPNSAALLQRINRMPPRSQEAQVLAARLILQAEQSAQDTSGSKRQ